MVFFYRFSARHALTQIGKDRKLDKG